jgi:hypothetical protein
MEFSVLVETRIKPYLAQVDAEARREVQRKRYKRNQVFGLMVVAAAILVWWLFHTNPGWIFRSERRSAGLLPGRRPRAPRRRDSRPYREREDRIIAEPG